MHSSALWKKVEERAHHRPEGLKPSHDPEFRCRVDMWLDVCSREASQESFHYITVGGTMQRILFGRPFHQLTRTADGFHPDRASDEWKRKRTFMRSRAKY
jgi:hypothetical protein